MAIYGAKGLAYIKVNALEKGAEGLQSPILKFLPEDVDKYDSGAHRRAEDGDLIFFGADKAQVVNEALGALRAKVGPRSRPRRTWLEAVVGDRFSDVRT